jgi:hypothetical protein
MSLHPLSAGFPEPPSPLVSGDGPSCVLCLAKRDMKRTLTDMLPLKPETLTRPQTAVDEYRRDVPKKERVFGLDRLLPPHGRPEALKGTPIFYNPLSNGRC